MAQAECGRLPQNSGASADALRKCRRFSPTRMATSKQRDNSECWRGCGKTASLGHRWWECETVQPSNSLEVPQSGPRNSTLGCRNAYTNVHSRIIPNRGNWKQSPCPSADEWVKKGGPALQWNVIWKEVLMYITTWMDPENVTEKPVTKGYRLYDSVYKKCPEAVDPQG